MLPHMQLIIGQILVYWVVKLCPTVSGSSSSVCLWQQYQVCPFPEQVRQGNTVLRSRLSCNWSDSIHAALTLLQLVTYVDFTGPSNLQQQYYVKLSI